MRKNLAKTKSNFSIQSFEGGYDKNFSYLITCLETITTVIVDASLESIRLQPFQKSRPKAILFLIVLSDFLMFFLCGPSKRILSLLSLIFLIDILSNKFIIQNKV